MVRNADERSATEAGRFPQNSFSDVYAVFLTEDAESDRIGSFSAIQLIFACEKILTLPILISIQRADS